MQIEFIQCSAEVAMETLGKRQICTTNEKIMADSRFALCNENIVEKLEENLKNKNTLKATQTWLNVWVTGRKVNPKSEEFEHEQFKEESATE